MLKSYVGSSWDTKQVAVSASPDAFKALNIYANTSSTRTEQSGFRDLKWAWIQANSNMDTKKMAAASA